jgi:hypothetical protein
LCLLVFVFFTLMNLGERIHTEHTLSPTFALFIFLGSLLFCLCLCTDYRGEGRYVGAHNQACKRLWSGLARLVTVYFSRSFAFVGAFGCFFLGGWIGYIRKPRSKLSRESFHVLWLDWWWKWYCTMLLFLYFVC